MFQVRRREASFRIRVEAAELARERPIDVSVSNGEEYLYRTSGNVPTFIGSFTKGLRHLDDGQLYKVDHFQAFVRAIDSGNEAEIARLPLGPPRDEDDDPIWRSEIARNARGNSANPMPAVVRGWESMGAGLAFDLQGPDAQAIAIPPAPKLTSPELQAEIAEVYLMALARDIPISDFKNPKYADFFEFATGALNNLEWFEFPEQSAKTSAEKARIRGPVSVSNIFRGITPGAQKGPYLSQFLNRGSSQLGNKDPSAELDGRIRYGSISIDQKVCIVTENVDFLTARDVFLDVQDGADLRETELYKPGTRFITTPRDLATYVHYDNLYQAYLNACIILLNNNAPKDPGLPFLLVDRLDKQQGFATFGGPYILSLVTEVATRALKAVRFQKFNVHRRVRPEALGGFIDEHVRNMDSDTPAFPELRPLVSGILPILNHIEQHNREQNIQAESPLADIPSYLLPMAFPEGSPMHPSYGSGHAVVAGACITTLKAFFDSSFTFEKVYEVDTATGTLIEAKQFRNKLTVEGELNKLAENISIGRNWAGVHYFTDYYESLLQGEAIAIGILEEQRLQFGENYSLSLPKFDGTTIRI